MIFLQNIELVCINTDENIEAIKQNITSLDSINIKYVPESMSFT